MALPVKYNYLLGPDMPKMITEGLKLYGIHEVVGPQHNATILGWGDAIGIGHLVNDDEQAWCGLFVAYVATRAQKYLPMKGWDLLRALEWVRFGTAVKTAALGDVLIFVREGGGHVGIYVGEDATHYHVLGGNQGNQVSITRIAKTRLKAIRRPIYQNQPASVRAVHISADGTASTSNEA